MPISISHSLGIILVCSAVTLLIRACPFLIFRRSTPRAVLYLGEVLPYAIMGMLVIYCLKDTDLRPGRFGLPEILASALTVLLHRWKHNTLMSILCGTLCYMTLVQLLF